MNKYFAEGLFSAEDEFLLFIQSIRCGTLDSIMIFITSLGDKGLIWIAAALILVLLKKHRKTGIKILTALCINLAAVNLILKNLIRRPRPFDVIEGLYPLITAPQDWSFPSGHTASSFAAGVIMLMKLPAKYGIPAMVLAVMIGISRIYIGVHYPSDVIAGALIGTLSALAADRLIDSTLCCRFRKS